MLQELEMTETDVESVETDLAPEPEPEKVAPTRGRRRVSGRENMRISSEEAKRLKDVKRTSSRIKADKVEDDANLNDPNAGDVNNPG